MKGIVMEKSKKHMVVMKTNGTFVKMRMQPNVEIGSEINIAEKPSMFISLYKYVSFAAAAIVILIGGINVKAYYTPYGYINIDINPSIQLGFNKFERVISIEALNEDGIKIIQNVTGIKNAKVEKAARIIAQSACDFKYIKDDAENDIVLSLYTPDLEKGDKIKERINNSVNNYFINRGKKVELMNEMVTKEDIERAKLKKISVGKLILYERAKQVNPNITLEDVKHKPVRDIVKIIKEAKKENKVIENSSTKADDVKDESRNIINSPTKKPDKPNFENKIIKPHNDKPIVENRSSDSMNQNSANNKNEIENSILNKQNNANKQNKENIPQPLQIPQIDPQKKANEKIKEIQNRIKQIDNRTEQIYNKIERH